MGLAELTKQLQEILNEYEGQGREPQRVLEMIACLVRESDEINGVLPRQIDQIKITVDGWERGDRPDKDALETIAALARQLDVADRTILD